MKIWKAAIAAASVMCLTGAHASVPNPKPKELTRAVQAFLADHGDLCLAEWDANRPETIEHAAAAFKEASAA